MDKKTGPGEKNFWFYGLKPNVWWAAVSCPSPSLSLARKMSGSGLASRAAAGLWTRFAAAGRRNAAGRLWEGIAGHKWANLQKGPFPTLKVEHGLTVNLGRFCSKHISCKSTKPDFHLSECNSSSVNLQKQEIRQPQKIGEEPRD